MRWSIPIKTCKGNRSERLWLVLGLTEQREEGELGEWRVVMSLRERTSLCSHRPCHCATRHRRLGPKIVFGTIGLVQCVVGENGEWNII